MEIFLAFQNRIVPVNEFDIGTTHKYKAFYTNVILMEV